jgi:hypothetical protein
MNTGTTTATDHKTKVETSANYFANQVSAASNYTAQKFYSVGTGGGGAGNSPAGWSGGSGIIPKWGNNPGAGWDSEPTWGGEAASDNAANGWSSPGIQYATGGIFDRATAGIFGEAGREALVPLDNRAAGWDILRQILPEFGIQPFADGGIVGWGGSSNITINTTQPSSSDRETLVIVVDMSGKELTRQIMTGATKRLRLKLGKTK